MLATTYGWTKQDVAALTWAEINRYVSMIREDSRRQADRMRRHRRR